MKINKEKELLLSHEELKEIAVYDSDIGGLVWLKRVAQRVRTGDRVGCPSDKRGYRYVSIRGRKYFEHRLIWLYHHGKFPCGVIDHINGDRTDNHIENLRVATKSENARNAGVQKNKTSEYKGVSWHKQVGKWRATTTSEEGKQIHLGLFDTEEEAFAAFCKMAIVHHGEFYNSGLDKGGH